MEQKLSIISESVTSPSREEIIRGLGIQVARAMDISDMTHWRVMALGKQVDRLVAHNLQGIGPFTIVEHYETITAHQMGRHSRLYLEPTITHIPMIIVADEVAARDLSRREPNLQFHSRASQHDGKILSAETYRCLVTSGILQEEAEQYIAQRKASFQMDHTRRQVRTEDLSHALDIRVSHDKIYHSGVSILVWPHDENQPLATDSMGKAIYGITLTNSPIHRPDAKWIPLCES